MEPLIMGQTSLKNSRLEENMTSFMENKELVAMTIILLLLSILCKFITGIFFKFPDKRGGKYVGHGKQDTKTV